MCVNIVVVYWSRRKNIDIVLENKFRVCILKIGRSIIIRNSTIIPRKTIIKEVVVLSFSNVAVAQACNIRKLLKILNVFLPNKLIYVKTL